MAKIDLAHILDIDPDKLNNYIFYPAVYGGKYYPSAIYPKGGTANPLADYAKDRENTGKRNTAWWYWLAWYYGDNNGWKDGWQNWKCDYILSFMQFRPEGRKDIWLFGGIFENMGLNIQEGKEKEQGPFYEVDLTEQGQEYIGRLKIIYNKPSKNPYAYLSSVYEKLEVSDIVKPYTYSDPSFGRYEDISLDFTDFEFIFRHNKDDWRRALWSIKGVYVIFDKKTGKKYVGSAYGEDGIWGRWCKYAVTVHGGNKELKKLCADKNDPRQYARENFNFTLLEWFPSNQTTEPYIRERERRWKEILLSRGDFGYNAN